MSSIASLSGSASGLYSFIQSLSHSNKTSAASAASSTGPSQSAASGQITGAGGGHHHHHGGGGAFKQIQDAVTSALQGAQSSGASSADPNQIIEDAIAKVLQNNNSATGAAQGTSNTTGDGPVGSANAVNGQSFQQLLQSFGVSPQQFRQDFLSAIKDAQGGQMSPATALQSFPVGSTLDTKG
jgi:hypothetical protein